MAILNFHYKMYWTISAMKHNDYFNALYIDNLKHMIMYLLLLIYTVTRHHKNTTQGNV